MAVKTRHPRPLTVSAVRHKASQIRLLLAGVLREYPEILDWCYSLNENRGFDKPIVQVSDPSDPTGQTVLQREALSRALERAVCRRLDHALVELTKAANWIRDIQEQQKGL